MRHIGRVLFLIFLSGCVGLEGSSFLETEMKQIHLHPPKLSDIETSETPQSQTLLGTTRPTAPQFFSNPMTALGSGTSHSMKMGAPELLMISHGNSVGVPTIPPSMYFTSPYDYESDDASNPVNSGSPDTWFDRIHRTKDVHKRTYNSVMNGMVPRMGFMGTGIHRPINPLVEAQELSDIDPWRQLAIQRYAFFRSPARNPEIRGPTLRRLQKSQVSGFDHTNGQYGVPLGTGLRGIGSATMGLTKFDYGPYGLGPIHPNPIKQMYNSAIQGVVNQAAAPLAVNAILGYAPPILPFS